MSRNFIRRKGKGGLEAAKEQELFYRLDAEAQTDQKRSNRKMVEKSDTLASYIILMLPRNSEC